MNFNDTHAELLREKHATVCNYNEINLKCKVDFDGQMMSRYIYMWQSKYIVQYYINSIILIVDYKFG